VYKRCHNIDSYSQWLEKIAKCIPAEKEYAPRGRTVGPNNPRCCMMDLMDDRRDESIRPLKPSVVPEDCIILCIDRRACLMTPVLETASRPTTNMIITGARKIKGETNHKIGRD